MIKNHLFRIALIAVIAAFGFGLTGCGEHAEPLDFEVPGNGGPR